MSGSVLLYLVSSVYVTLFQVMPGYVWLIHVGCVDKIRSVYFRIGNVGQIRSGYLGYFW